MPTWWKYIISSNPIQAKNLEDQCRLLELHEFAQFMESLLVLPKQASELHKKVIWFKKLDLSEAILMLPELYLRFEHHLTEQDTYKLITKEKLRQTVCQKFPWITDMHHVNFIFKPEVPISIYLSKLFLIAVSKRVVEVFGTAQEQYFQYLKEWSQHLPKVKSPLPDQTLFLESAPTTQSLNKYLVNMSLNLCQVLETKMGEIFTRGIYNESYREIADSYRWLEDFPVIISMIPRNYLSIEKISLLSKHQLASTLLEKVSFLEELNTQLNERTKALEKTQKMLQKTIQDLKESNQQLEEFAYIASHDLQEPLRTIGGFSNLILKAINKNESDAIAEYANYIDTGAKRMNQLIQNLLSFAKINEGKKPKQEVLLTTIAEIILFNLKVSIDNAKASVHFNIEDNIALFGVRSQLIQLFQNLISNAIKFARPNTFPDVKINVESQDTFWLFSVSDNGVGIPTEQQQLVFEIFKRASSSQEQVGTGIGLAIVKKIVENHGGKIWLNSVPGQGSTFFFTLKKH